MAEGALPEIVAVDVVPEEEALFPDEELLVGEPPVVVELVLCLDCWEEAEAAAEGVVAEVVDVEAVEADERLVSGDDEPADELLVDVALSETVEPLELPESECVGVGDGF